MSKDLLEEKVKESERSIKRLETRVKEDGEFSKKLLSENDILKQLLKHKNGIMIALLEKLVNGEVGASVTLDYEQIESVSQKYDMKPNLLGGEGTNKKVMISLIKGKWWGKDAQDSDTSSTENQEEQPANIIQMERKQD